MCVCVCVNTNEFYKTQAKCCKVGDSMLIGSTIEMKSEGEVGEEENV